MVKRVRRITFKQFAARRGVSMVPDTCEFHRLPGVHGRTRKRAMAEAQWRCVQHGIELERLKMEYACLVATGEIVPPTDEERLEATASGHPDKASTQAARRVLAKRAARREDN